MQLLFALKQSYNQTDLMHLADCLFERLGCGVVCLLSEAGLVASAYRFLNVRANIRDEEAQAHHQHQHSSTSPSVLIVDIGSRITTIYPVYEGIIMLSAVEKSSIGGEHCTDFMELLLSAQHSDTFSSLLPRRKKLLSRLAKEQHGFVSLNFELNVLSYGGFRLDKIKSKTHSDEFDTNNSRPRNNSIPPAPIKAATPNRPRSCRITMKTPTIDKKRYPKDDMSHTLRLNDYDDDDNDEIERAAVSIPTVTPASEEMMRDITKSFQCTLPNGSEIQLNIDKERFYACEVLFVPSLFNGEGANSKERGVVQVILDTVANIDETVRDEICSNIVISGRSGLIPGLTARLQRCLASPMRALGVSSFSITLAEDKVDIKNNNNKNSARKDNKNISHDDENKNINGNDNSMRDENNVNRDDNTLTLCSEGYASPTGCWRGASARLKRMAEYPIEEQNFVTLEDYNEYGPSLIQDFVVG